MISCASALAMLVAVDSTVPAELEQRVREAVGSLWGIESEVVRLDWGRLPKTGTLQSTSRFRLVGRGADGRFVVVFETGAGTVAAGVRAGREGPVWVARRVLPAGAVVKASDVASSVSLLWGPPTGPRTSPVGWRVRRPLAIGDAVLPSAVVEPAVIASGDLVRFEWMLGGMRVSREGVASVSARRGGLVIARDHVRRETLRGIALGPGRARLERSRR